MYVLHVNMLVVLVEFDVRQEAYQAAACCVMLQHGTLCLSCQLSSTLTRHQGQDSVTLFGPYWADMHTPA